MIKYLGSKRRLVPALAAIADGAGARTAADLFTGTTRVAQAFKRQGIMVTAVDTATYAEVLARTYIATDRAGIVWPAVLEAVSRLSALPGRRGYVTRVFCEQARYFHPENGERIDAIRDEIESRYVGTDLYPLLLTSLLEAADRVDSTTGLQMAYLKSWAPRALRPLELRPPDLLAGPGIAVRGDAIAVARNLPHVDLAYVDPPYNQHRYFSNYHVWETLVRWDAPKHYGVACKRIDCRDASSMSPFNKRPAMAAALADVIGAVDAEVMVVSYNDEAWLTLEELVGMCSRRRLSFGPNPQAAGAAAPGSVAGSVPASVPASVSAKQPASVPASVSPPAPASISPSVPTNQPRSVPESVPEERTWQPIHVEVLAADSKRYVGAQIGIHNPAGVKVGAVSHLRNKELLVISGPARLVESARRAGERALGPVDGVSGRGNEKRADAS